MSEGKKDGGKVGQQKESVLITKNRIAKKPKGVKIILSLTNSSFPLKSSIPK